jgi:hypothetical protein
MTKKISEMSPHEFALYKENRRKNAIRMKSYNKIKMADLAWRERQRLRSSENNKKRQADPSLAKKYRELNRARMKKKYESDPEYRSRVVEYARKLRADPEKYAKKLEYQKSYNPRRKFLRQLNAQYEEFIRVMERESASATQ